MANYTMMRFIYFFLFLFIVTVASAQERKTEKLIMITLDGFRWDDLYTGADEDILFSKKAHRYISDTSVVKQFWRDDQDERRKALLPFFWNTIAREGQLYGNRAYGNSVSCANFWVYSYTGYNEMFVGFVDPKIKNNDPIVNRNTNVLQHLHQHPSAKKDVAVFSTWKVMPYILRAEDAGFHINSGYDKAVGNTLSENEKMLNILTDSIKNPYGERYDNFTFQYAFEYLKRERPDVLYISLDETDEHGHGERYDEYLKSAHRTDKMISELWQWIQSQDDYRDKTTLFITTDHGRGTRAARWFDHKVLVRGSGHIWFAVMGPDTPPTGEMKTKMRLKQKQVAQTLAAFFDLPYENRKPVGEVITTMFKGREVGERPVITAEGARP